MNRFRFYRDAENVAFVKKHCVATALDVWDNRVERKNRGQDSPECQFYEKVAGSSNSYTVTTASGQVLGDLIASPLPKLLEKWNALPEAERRPGALKVPDLPPGVARVQTNLLPAGALVLRGWIRPVLRTASGDIQPRPLESLGYGWYLLDVPREGAWITQAEWQALIPKDPQQGTAVPAPRSLRDRLVRFHLADWYRNGGPWVPADVRTAELTAVVEAVSSTAIQLRLQGRALIANHADPIKASQGYDGVLHGRLTYDRGKQRFTRFDLFAVGDAWWTGKGNFPAGGLATKGTIWRSALGRQTIGMAFELAGPGTRVLPRYLRSGGYPNFVKAYLTLTPLE